jgi:hypothetical protein
MLFIAAGCCLGVTCTITPGTGITTQKPLSQAVANITVSRLAGAGTASVAATIEDALGRTVTLSDDQAVRVNDVALVGPSSGVYAATVTAAGQYVLAVQEPTRGVETTTVSAPTDFEVTSPAEDGGVSLSGFTLQWSGADNQAQVVIELSQWQGSTRVIDNFGPYTDTGSRAFDATDLRDFVQGTPLTITISKYNVRSNVAGFASGTLQISVITERHAQPLP